MSALGGFFGGGGSESKAYDSKQITGKDAVRSGTLAKGEQSLLTVGGTTTGLDFITTGARAKSVGGNLNDVNATGKATVNITDNGAFQVVESLIGSAFETVKKVSSDLTATATNTVASVLDGAKSFTGGTTETQAKIFKFGALALCGVAVYYIFKKGK